MHGHVEIWQGDKLISSESNLIVDGASEIICNLLTVSPSLSANQYFSGLLNTSNYTIQSVSFGKDASSFQFNAHQRSRVILSGLSSTPSGIYIINPSSTSSLVSSYLPTNGLPSYPDPLDTMLENLPSGVSSLIRTYGQNLNLLPYWSSVSAASSFGSSGAILFGCYPLSSGSFVSLYSPTSSFTISAILSSNTFNRVSSMDWRGFVKRSSVSSVSGLLLSSTTNGISSLGEVIYTITLGSGDLAYTNFYGGIYSMGLWCIDLVRLLQNGVQPPYVFNPITNPIEYKLFAKKVFNKNLAYIQDIASGPGLTNYSNLTVRWRLYF